MPHFILSHGQLGPLIELYIGVSAPLATSLKNQGVPVPSSVLVKGLVDTGASHTAVDSALLAGLNISAKRLALVITPTTGATPVKAHTFDVSLYIPLGTPGAAPWGKAAWEVTRQDLNHQGFDVLIGRDLLAEALLVYDGKHAVFTLGF